MNGAKWNAILCLNVHPTQVLITEAMEWIGEPVSPALLTTVFGDGFDVGHVGYHVRKLAEAGVLTMVDTRPVRGALEHFYLLVPAAVRHVEFTAAEYELVAGLVLAEDSEAAQWIYATDDVWESAREKLA
jgi:hypothetical protein